MWRTQYVGCEIHKTRFVTNKALGKKLDLAKGGAPCETRAQGSMFRTMADDFVLVGGGLQNGLVALALLHRHPGIRLTLIERDDKLGGNHTWSFHVDDVSSEAWAWVEPLVECQWDRYEVIFPGHRRVMEHRYASISSEKFGKVLLSRFRDAEHCRVVLGQAVRRVEAHAVELDSGERIDAHTVVDSRGPSSQARSDGAGFQKFVGLELELDRPSSIAHPVIMDATVDQRDGYRFVYVLPFAPSRLLIEDTYFSDDPTLDTDVLCRRVLEYLARLDAGPATIVRQEQGVLPMPWVMGDGPERDGILRGGYEGGWFHPATGYSLPVAVRLAEFIADQAPGSPFGPRLEVFRKAHEDQVRFALRLNRMLFRLVPSSWRWRIFRRFYRLPEDTIRRFYTMQTRPTDRARIVFGWP